MAKGQRSNRQKALRTVRREKIKATWQEDADRKRMEALRKCIEAPPVQLKEHEIAIVEEAKAKARRAPGGSEAMEAEGAGAGGAAAAGAARKRGKGGKRNGKKGVTVGARKGRKKQVGVLSKMSGNQFHKAKGKK